MSQEIILKYDVFKIDTELKILGKRFVDENKNNFKILYDIERELTEYLSFEDDPYYSDEELEIKLIQVNPINNLSHMFSECELLLSVTNIAQLDTSQVIDMSYMFYNCKELRELIYYICLKFGYWIYLKLKI